MFTELLAPLFCHNNNVSFIHCMFTITFSSCYALITWISCSYYSHLIMTFLELHASLEDVRLPSHQSGEFVVAFCLLMFINIFSASCIHLDHSLQSESNLCILPPQLHTWPRDLLHEIKRNALELYCNRTMKDLETLTRCDAG